MFRSSTRSLAGICTPRKRLESMRSMRNGHPTGGTGEHRSGESPPARRECFITAAVLGRDVVAHYDRHLKLGLSGQEGADLIAFLQTL